MFRRFVGVALFFIAIAPVATLGDESELADDPYCFDHRVNLQHDRDRTDQARLVARDQGLDRLRAHIPGVRTEWSPLFETPSFLRSIESPLTTDQKQIGPTPLDTVARFMDNNPALFQADAQAIASAVVRRDAVSDHNGIRSIWLQQQINGIDIEGADLRATFDASGNLLTLGSRLLPQSGLETPIDRSLLSADEATVLAAGAAVGIDRFGELTFHRGAPGEAMTVVSAELGVIGSISGAPIYLPISRDQLRLCHRVTLRPAHNQGAYEVFVDAADQTALLSRSLVSDAGATPSYLVFTNDSPAPATPGPQAPDALSPAFVTQSVVSLHALDAVASPDGWLNPDLATTRGNNIESHSDTDNDDLSDLPLIQSSPAGVFHFGYDASQSHESNLNAAITQAFYTGNWFHDRMHQLGFTEPFGAFQKDNFGRGGVDGDPILIDVQDSRETNNARFISSGADGGVGRVEMSIWNGGGETRDSTVDIQILIHEFAHGVSLRLHRGLEGSQAAGMGEGWSDFFALALLAEPSDDLDGVYAIGSYAAFAAGDPLPFEDSAYFGLRRFPYSTNFAINPLTFEDIDPQLFAVSGLIPHSPIVAPGNPVRIHQIGEVWCSALWDVRAELIRAHGFVAGSELAVRLVVDGMILTTTSQPNMLAGRDAILIADVINNGGENLCLLWEAFARRGLGIDAESPDVGVNRIIESFAVPDTPRIIPFRSAPERVAPGAPIPVSLILDQRCGIERAGAQATLWHSINGGGFEPIPMLESSVGVLEADLPPLLCDDQIDYYFTIVSGEYALTYPEAGESDPLHAAGTPIISYDVLQPETRGAFDHFGFSCDRSDGLAIVGAFQQSNEFFKAGGAYIYSGGIASPGVEVALLTSPNPESSAQFGFSVAMDQGIACVGATGDSLRAPSAGAAYVYRANGLQWLLDGSLIALDGDTSDEFGVDVSVSGTTIAVGAKGNDTQGSNAGAVYIFDRSGPGQWAQTRRLLVLDGSPGDSFGAAVDIQGDWLIAGSPNDDSGQGSVYVFRRTQGFWSLHSKLLAPVRRVNAKFGVSLALDQDRILIGAESDNNQVFGVGIAYTYVFDDADDSWIFESSLGVLSLSGGDKFGSRVDLRGDLAVISAPRRSAAGSRSGAVYIFENDVTDGWVLREGPLTPVGLNTPGIGFGSAVAIDAHAVTAGAWLAGDIFDSAGAAFTFEPIPADCNADGQADICAIAAGLQADTDLNGIPDSCQCAGDLNLDGFVNTADLGVMISEFGQPGDSLADLNADGIVDVADLGLILDHFGANCP